MSVVLTARDLTRHYEVSRGLFKGTALTVWRLLRCAPWHPGGVDPVPPAHTPRTSSPDGSRADPRSRPAENHEEQAPC